MPMPEVGDACGCAALDDLALVPMGGAGLDERVFATISQIRDHGGEPWWLYLSRCTACHQDWMVAQEERIYDEYLLRRLSRAQASAILNGSWPEEFLTFEQVLRIARERSRPPRFFDPRADALVTTAEDLRRARPAITIAEIAYLLGLTPRAAAALLRPESLWRRLLSRGA